MVTPIERDEVIRLIDAGAYVIDVLPEREYSESHLPGAINIPLKELTESAVEELRRDKPVVVY